LDVVELVVAGDAEWGQEERIAVFGGKALGGEGRSAEGGHDTGSGTGFPGRIWESVVTRSESHAQGGRHVAGDGDGFGEGAELSAEHAILEGSEGCCGGGGGRREKEGRDEEKEETPEHGEEVMDG